MRKITLALAGAAALAAAAHLAATAAPAAAAPPTDAIAFFKRYIALTDGYDARLGDLYADSAVLRVTARQPDGSTREMQLTGAQYKALLPQAVALAKRRGERTVFFDIRYTAEGERMRISATRHDVRGDYHAPHALLLTRDAGGGWMIVEETGETRAEPAAATPALEPDPSDPFASTPS